MRLKSPDGYSLATLIFFSVRHSLSYYREFEGSEIGLQPAYSYFRGFDKNSIMLYLFWEISAILLQSCKTWLNNMELKTNILLWMQLQNVADYKVTLAITSTTKPYITMWTDGKYEVDKLYLFGKLMEEDKYIWNENLSLS